IYTVKKQTIILLNYISRSTIISLRLFENIQADSFGLKSLQIKSQAPKENLTKNFCRQIAGRKITVFRHDK
ncbi:MAG: hypothetical protein UHG68_07735, partial [Clostridia bacterium]|nr:hypothetical protein [Clostridia bacterium]